MMTGISEIRLQPASLTERAVSRQLEASMGNAAVMRASIAYWTINENHFLTQSAARLLREPGSFLCVDIQIPTNLDVMAEMASEEANIYLHLARLANPPRRGDLVDLPHLLHQKMLLFDYPGDDAELWIGSHNWTGRALGGLNIESSIVLSLKNGCPLYQEASDSLELVRTRFCELMDPARLEYYKALQRPKNPGSENDVPVIEIEGEKIGELIGQTIRIFGTSEEEYVRGLLSVNNLVTLNAEESSTEKKFRYSARIGQSGNLPAATEPSDSPGFSSTRWAIKNPGQLPLLRAEESEPSQEMVDTCAYFITLEILEFANVELYMFYEKIDPWRDDENSPLLDGIQNVADSPGMSTVRIQTPNEKWVPRVKYQPTLAEKRASSEIPLVRKQQSEPIN